MRAALASSAATSAIAVARCMADSRWAACLRVVGDVEDRAQQPHRLAARVGDQPGPGRPSSAPSRRPCRARNSAVNWPCSSIARSMASCMGATSSGCTNRPSMAASDSNWMAPSRPNSAAQRSSQSMTTGPQVAFPRADRTGLQRHVQPGGRGADRGPGGGELQLGHDGGGQLLEECGLVVGPVPRLGVVDGQRPDHVAGRRDERGAEVGPDLARRHRRQVRHPVVLARVGEAERGAVADDDGRERAGQQGGPTDHPRRQAEPADDGVLVGEQRDLGVAGIEDPGGQRGEPVERGRAVHLDEAADGRPRSGAGRAADRARRGRASARWTHVPLPSRHEHDRPGALQHNAGTRVETRSAPRRRASPRAPACDATRAGDVRRIQGRRAAGRWTTHARHAHGAAAGLPSAARRPRRPDAGLPADRRPRRRHGGRVRGAGPLPRLRRSRRLVRRRRRGRGRRRARGPGDPQGAGRRPRAAARHLPDRQRQPAHPRRRRRCRTPWPPAPTCTASSSS